MKFLEYRYFGVIFGGFLFLQALILGGWVEYVLAGSMLGAVMVGWRMYGWEKSSEQPEIKVEKEFEDSYPFRELAGPVREGIEVRIKYIDGTYRVTFLRPGTSLVKILSTGEGRSISEALMEAELKWIERDV